MITLLRVVTQLLASPVGREAIREVGRRLLDRVFDETELPPLKLQGPEVARAALWAAYQQGRFHPHGHPPTICHEAMFQVRKIRETILVDYIQQLEGRIRDRDGVGSDQ